MEKKREFEVDRRVGIAMSVLPLDQQDLVNSVIRSLEEFEIAESKIGRVSKVNNSKESLYELRISPTLCLFFTKDDMSIRILDIVERATLARFARPKCTNISSISTKS